MGARKRPAGYSMCSNNARAPNEAVELRPSMTAEEEGRKSSFLQARRCVRRLFVLKLKMQKLASSQPKEAVRFNLSPLELAKLSEEVSSFNAV
eukprot:760955-Hanusia_phi.AAC.1